MFCAALSTVACLFFPRAIACAHVLGDRAVSERQAAARPIALMDGQPRSDVIGAGEHRFYEIRLNRGEVAIGRVSAVGISVTLQVRDGSGAVLSEALGVAGATSPFHVVAGEAGTYKVEIVGVGIGKGSFRIAYDSLSVTEYADRLDRREFGEESEMYRIAHDIRDRGENAIDALMAERKGNGPIVEPASGNANERTVTFLYRGDSHTEQVNTWAFTLGTAPLDMEAAGSMPMPMQRLAGSSLWYLRSRLPADTLLGYRYEVTRSHPAKTADGRAVVVRDEPIEINDPLMSDAIFGRSILRLPAAPDQPWIVPNRSAPAGSVTPYKLFSEAMGETRRYTVYLPGGKYREASGKRLLFIVDGEAYESRQSLVPTPTVLDNLIARGTIPPTVAVFVHAQGQRDRDLVNSAAFQRFMAGELLPAIQRTFDVTKRPEETVIAGSSLGGRFAAELALRYPNHFGAALCQSPAMYPAKGSLDANSSFVKIRDGYALTAEYRDTKRKPIRFYMDSGLFEGPLLDGDRQFRDVLKLKGYPLIYVEHAGSHDYVYWRNSIGDGLAVLLGKSSTRRSKRISRRR